MEGVRIPYLKVSRHIFYRVFSEEVSEVRVFKGESLEGTGITLKAFEDVFLGNSRFLHPFFPFSAYGGLLARERLEENPDGEDPFGIEPLYLRPPA
ncbi:MAG: hypothetical protein Q9N34_01020 [Aquificota bacterium]|nr:hypothetical protein [Aquificota bacterium]